MIRRDDDFLTWVMLLDEVCEAHTHLGELISKLERTADFDEVDIMVRLGHIYGHLNRFWNGRHISGGDVDKLYKEENTSFPDDVLLT